MNIRAAHAGDAASIRSLVNDLILNTFVSFKSTPRSQGEVAEMIATRPVLIAEDGAGRFLGYGTYDQLRRGSGYERAMEHTLALEEEARGKGVGRALLTAIEAHARNAGAGSIWAGVSAENPEGRAFHLAMGYTLVATLPSVGWKRERWLDLHLMRKALLPEI